MKKVFVLLFGCILAFTFSACQKDKDEHHEFKAKSTHTHGHITSNTATFILQKQSDGKYKYILNTDFSNEAGIYVVIGDQDGPFYNSHFNLADMKQCVYSDGFYGQVECLNANMSIDSYKYGGKGKGFVQGSFSATFYRDSFIDGSVVCYKNDTIRITDGKFYITIDDEQ